MNKKSKQLYVVRGSGYSIDNSIVTIAKEHEVDGEKFLSVNPATPRIVGQHSILINEKYLQPINDRIKQYVYTFTVSKTCLDDRTTEQDLCIIDNAMRNMDVSAILEKFERELTPLLRLE